MRNWIIGLAAAAVVAVAAPAIAQVNWTWVTDRAERFSIEMPGAAVKGGEAVKTGQGALPSVTYEVELEKGYFSVMSTTVPAGALSAEQIATGLDAAIQGALKAGQATATWKRNLKVSGQEAREAEYTTRVEGLDTRGRVLVTYRDGRLYTVLSMESATEPAGASERMVRSFRLLD